MTGAPHAPHAPHAPRAPRSETAEPEREDASGRDRPPRWVNHTYRDYSHVSAEGLPRRKSATLNFPSKLHRILSTEEFAHVSLEIVASFAANGILSPCSQSPLTPPVLQRNNAHRAVRRSSLGRYATMRDRGSLLPRHAGHLAL